MRNISKVLTTGIVKFVGDKGEDVSGSVDDCLAYAFKYQSGDCYAYSLTQSPQYSANKNSLNEYYGNNIVRGGLNKINAGERQIVNGYDNETARNSNQTIINGQNAYSENFGENVYGINRQKNIARYTKLQFAGFTTDDTVTELFIGNRSENRFTINPNYASSYFIQFDAVAMNADSGEMWSFTNFKAFRYIDGNFTEVGNHTGTKLRDSNLDYDFDLTPITSTSKDNYIKVTCLGEANHNVYWNSTLKITEVRTPEIVGSNMILNPDFLGTPSWQKINQDSNNIITIPFDSEFGGVKMVGNGTRNLACRYPTITWGTNRWKITFTLEQVLGNNLEVQVRVNNQNSQIFNTVGVHTYYVDTVGGANFMQFMINQTTGAAQCIINNVKAEIVTYGI